MCVCVSVCACVRVCVSVCTCVRVSVPSRFFPQRRSLRLATARVAGQADHALGGIHGVRVADGDLAHAIVHELLLRVGERHLCETDGDLEVPLWNSRSARLGAEVLQ